MSGQQTLTSPNSDRFHAMSAGFLGWTLDAFDFFVVIFLFDTLAAHFHVPKKQIVLSVTATLMMRPLGALLFGMMADRYGRRRPLMWNVLFFSIVELLCGFAPNFTVFFILRMLFGIGMGGEWGVGASLAMEHAPVQWRGVLSGILQSGYPIGYLLAALAARLVLPSWGWRAMFWVGGIPALLALYIRTKVPESEAWERHRLTRTLDGPRIAWQHKWLSLYLIVLMFLMNCLSHGTQDLYPDFLKHGHSVAQNTVTYITMFYNVGAVVGAVIFGLLSERLGRRHTMVMALAVALFVMPAWAFGSTLTMLAVGAFLMQMGVQGAWGIIPVHLNELSPDAVRGLLPGFTYQVGILLAALTPTVEFALRDRLGYAWALTSFELVVIAALSLMLVFGKEKRGRSFVQGSEGSAA
ncbi:MAG TPA: MFS transporter [Verrucomicrobiae bacterium]|jgi:SHS family lactate transporter-like MFS transporter|nr:MFS transporter [Verrucomicrobiae bacterium]